MRNKLGLLPQPTNRQMTADERKEAISRLLAGETQQAVADDMGFTRVTMNRLWRSYQRLNAQALGGEPS